MQGSENNLFLSANHCDRQWLALFQLVSNEQFLAELQRYRLQQ